MAQVKKASVQDRILKSAHEIFRDASYQWTSLAAIARAAGITPGNIYRYYPSKFELFYAVLEEWLAGQFTQLEKDCARIKDPADRVRHILWFMWVELPERDNHFVHNLMQALATKNPEEPYSRTLLDQSRRQISGLLITALPSRFSRAEIDSLVHFIFMSHDGFVLNSRLYKEEEHIRIMTDRLIGFLFGDAAIETHPVRESGNGRF